MNGEARREGVPVDGKERREGVPVDGKERREGVPVDGKERREGVPVDKDAPRRAITGFHQDEDGHWVAELACGHTQHMRHQPPWQNRPWTRTSEGRAAFVGVEVRCPVCAREPGGG